MRWFWETAIEPLLAAVEARTLVEVGVQQGVTTTELIAFVERHDGIVHGIDPVPLATGIELAERHDSFVLHRDLSLNVLPQLTGLDAALIDGDHNWYTVINELRALAASSDAQGRDLPLTFLHDVGWPYGRRDMYFNPDAIPAEHRQPFARGGLWPGSEELHGNTGVNAGARHALSEGTPRNGVLTAVEDFVAESERALHLTTLPGMNGLAILLSEERLRASDALRGALEGLHSAAALRSACERIELARNELHARADTLRRELRAATRG